MTRCHERQRVRVRECASRADQYEAFTLRKLSEARV